MESVYAQLVESKWRVAYDFSQLSRLYSSLNKIHVPYNHMKLAKITEICLSMGSCLYISEPVCSNNLHK